MILYDTHVPHVPLCVFVQSKTICGCVRLHLEDPVSSCVHWSSFDYVC